MTDGEQPTPKPSPSAAGEAKRTKRAPSSPTSAGTAQPGNKPPTGYAKSKSTMSRDALATARGIIPRTPGRGGKAKPASWPACNVEMVPIKELVPCVRNARTHSQSQRLSLARSLEKFGWTNSVLRDEANEIIAGHGRLLGAEILVERGLKQFEFAPVITARGWTEAQKRAYRIADNQLALAAGWDMKLLEGELKELSGMGFQMELLGFSAHELRRFVGMSGAGGADADLAPELSAVAVSRAGDLWLCGPHRILCGDSTSKVDVSRIFDGKLAALMVTDPPYGVDYDPAWRKEIGAFARDKCATGQVQNDDRVDWTAAWHLFPGPVAYVWHAGKFCAAVEDSLRADGFEIRSQIIWRKAHYAIGRGDYHWQHEPCWYAVRKGAKGNWRGGRKQSTIWDIAGLNPAGRGAQTQADQATGHGTQKPVECMLRPIENNTAEGDIVYDPFLGSGTTLIAAAESKRVCFALELDPRYVDVALRRWQRFSGQAALLSGRNLSFEEIEGERKPSKTHGSTRAEASPDTSPRARRQPKRPPAEQPRADAAS